MKAIIVTGTPGCGKTTFAKEYAEKNEFVYVDANKVISDNKLCEQKDIERDCIVVDETKLSDILVDMIKKSDNVLVIDSHMSHFIPKEFVSECHIIKCTTAELALRLEKRGYSKDKIKENLECEIFDVCLNEAKDAGHNVIVHAEE